MDGYKPKPLEWTDSREGEYARTHLSKAAEPIQGIKFHVVRWHKDDVCIWSAFGQCDEAHTEAEATALCEAKWQAAALPAVGFPRWLPVATIPQDGTPVLVVDGTGIFRPEIAWEDGSGATMRDYAFWMPLPSAPHCAEIAPES